MFDHQTSWTVEHLKGSARMAAEDAAARERLDRQIRSIGFHRGDPAELRCVDCHQLLPANGTAERCKRCRNRLHMKEERAGKSKSLRAEKAASLETVPCVACGVAIRKWTPQGNLRKCCDACVKKSWRWRMLQRRKPEAA